MLRQIVSITATLAAILILLAHSIVPHHTHDHGICFQIKCYYKSSTGHHENCCTILTDHDKAPTSVMIACIDGDECHSHSCVTPCIAILPDAESGNSLLPELPCKGLPTCNDHRHSDCCNIANTMSFLAAQPRMQVICPVNDAAYSDLSDMLVFPKEMDPHMGNILSRQRLKACILSLYNHCLSQSNNLRAPPILKMPAISDLTGVS